MAVRRLVVSRGGAVRLVEGRKLRLTCGLRLKDGLIPDTFGADGRESGAKNARGKGPGGMCGGWYDNQAVQNAPGRFLLRSDAMGLASRHFDTHGPIQRLNRGRDTGIMVRAGSSVVGGSLPLLHVLTAGDPFHRSLPQRHPPGGAARRRRGTCARRGNRRGRHPGAEPDGVG